MRDIAEDVEEIEPHVGDGMRRATATQSEACGRRIGFRVRYRHRVPAQFFVMRDSSTGQPSATYWEIRESEMRKRQRYE